MLYGEWYDDMKYILYIMKHFYFSNTDSLTDKEKPPKKKKRRTQEDFMIKIDQFIECQENADKLFWEREREKEKRGRTWGEEKERRSRFFLATC